jgi:subtilase family serine protease
VLAVTGLDNAAPVTSPAEPAPAPDALTAAAKTATCSQYWAQYVKSFRPAYQGLTKGAVPVCGYSAGQIRAAYGATAAATGKGQTVALTEDATPVAMLATLTDCAKKNHLPAPASAQFRQQQITVKGSCGTAAPGDAAQLPYDDESQMDSEALYAMAPGAHQLLVIASGCNENQDLLDAVLTGNGKWTDLGVDLGSGGGTSLATPLIAGLVADAQQGQKSDFGFINQLLYRLAGPRAFHDILPVTAEMPQQDWDAYEAGSGLEGTGLDVFDSQEHAYTTQVSAKGYDTMTGIGTPNGAAFIAGLRAAAAS